MTASTEQYALVIGANGAIGRAAVEKFLERDFHVVAVSRKLDPALMQTHPDKLQWLETDYSEDSIAQLGDRLLSELSLKDRLRYAVIATGQLHGEGLKPEKRLNDLTVETLGNAFHINAITPALWIKAIRPLLGLKSVCRIAILSARVGSIDDNVRGGWYGYRAAKAALNMLVRNAAIELGRLAKHTDFILFHPGTTDSALSKPFQKGVPEGKLFSPQFVATQLFEQLQRQDLEGNIHFLDWQGEPVAW